MTPEIEKETQVLQRALAENRFADALAACRTLASLEPQNPAHSRQLAYVFMSMGRAADAVNALRKVLSLAPNDAQANNDLGILLANAGRIDEALQCFVNAVNANPQDARSYYNLGRCAERKGNVQDAATCYQRAVGIKDDFAEAHDALGQLLGRMGRVDDEISCFRRAVELRPESPELNNNYATALSKAMKLDEAEPFFRKAVALQDARPEFHENLAKCLRQQSRTQEAAEHFRRALALRPSAGNEIRLATLLPIIASSREDLESSRNRFEAEVARLLEAGTLKLADPIREVGSANFHLAYHGRNDKPVQQKVAQLYLKSCPSLAWTAPHCANPGPVPADRKIRVGLISRYFSQHTVGKVTAGIVEKLDRERFHVTVFHLGKEDPGSQAFAKLADAAIRPAGSLDQMRQAIAAQQLDILLYTDIGMEQTTYFLAFSRLAPVQCVTWGHPDTTGIPTIDYYISSRLIEPDDAQLHYSEKLAMLDTLLAYYYAPTRTAAPDRARLGQDASAHLYVCPQSLFKVHPEFDATLVRILRNDPAGRLLFFKGNSAHWEQILHARLRAAAAGGDNVADRIEFLPRMDIADFANVLACADVVLDTPHFGGGDTTYNALAVDAPIVTLPGPFARGRFTQACYRKMGYTDLVASSADQYVTLANRLASDAGFRDDARARIRQTKSVLFEDIQTVRQLEDFFTTACGQRS